MARTHHGHVEEGRHGPDLAGSRGCQPRPPSSVDREELQGKPTHKLGDYSLPNQHHLVPIRVDCTLFFSEAAQKRQPKSYTQRAKMKRKFFQRNICKVLILLELAAICRILPIPSKKPCNDRAGTRTQDPRLKRPMLYQLSYPVNQAPHSNGKIAPPQHPSKPGSFPIFHAPLRLRAVPLTDAKTASLFGPMNPDPCICLMPCHKMVATVCCAG